MQSTTDRLFDSLMSTEDIREHIESENDVLVEEETLPAYLEKLLLSHGLKRPEVFAAAGLSPSFGYQIFSGLRKPSRETALQLCFGFSLDVDGAQRLLRAARMGALYAREKRDSVIIFALNRGMTLVETSDLLDEKGLPALGLNG